MHGGTCLAQLVGHMTLILDLRVVNSRPMLDVELTKKCVCVRVYIYTYTHINARPCVILLTS